MEVPPDKGFVAYPRSHLPPGSQASSAELKRLRSAYRISGLTLIAQPLAVIGGLIMFANNKPEYAEGFAFGFLLALGGLVGAIISAYWCLNEIAAVSGKSNGWVAQMVLIDVAAGCMFCGFGPFVIQVLVNKSLAAFGVSCSINKSSMQILNRLIVEAEARESANR